MSDDLLERLLALAAAEGVLDRSGLSEAVSAFRARGDAMLGERVVPLEARVRELEGEREGLARELEWHRTTIANLERDKEALARETAWQRESLAGLQQERDAVAGEKQEATQAHDSLRAHHRHVVEVALRELAAAADAPAWQVRRTRERLRALIALLRRELE